MLVSVIIPIYKVEQYIERCLDSVLNQTYQKLEIILVDDCSPDSSMDIARSVISRREKNEYRSFKYLRHDRNRGLSAARNTGIDASTGDFIFFLDSDDEILPHCISSLVAESDNGRIDVVCGGLSFCGQIELMKYNTHYVCYDAFYQNDDDIIDAYVRGRIPISAWNKLLSRNVVLKEELYFKEGLLFEDNLWSFIMIHSISSLKTVSLITYNYWIRPGSIATSTEYVKRQYHMYEVMSERDRFVKLKGICNKETKSYLIKDKALWLQSKVCDNRFSLKEKYNLVSSVFSLNDKCQVLVFFVFYYFRWLLHKFKYSVCR